MLDAGASEESLGERLRRLRLERGLTQRDIATPGVSYAYISRIENGERRPSVRALRELAVKLGVTADYLETGTHLDGSSERELRLADVELRLRLDGDAPVEELAAILAEAESCADVTSATRARVALGLAAAARGDHAEVVAQLEAALALGLVDPLLRPDAYVTLGRAYSARGTARKAVELFSAALEDLERRAPEDVGSRVRFSSYLSFALTDAGELERAQAVVREVLSESGETGDPYARVRLHWSLGRLSIEQSRPLAALDSFRRAIALLEATEDTLHLARAHLNCAQALIDAGDLGQAADHLAQAERHLGVRPSDDDLASVRLMQAMLAARSGEHEAAERYGNEGLLLAQGLPNEQGQIWWALAEARAGAGKPEADAAFRTAIDLLGEHGTVREQTNVLRSYGRYLRETGRDAEALDVFERAAELAVNLQAHTADVDA